MISRLLTATLLIGTAGIISCDGRGQVTNPDLPATPVIPKEPLFEVKLSPKIDVLVEGDTVQLTAVAVDPNGSVIPGPYTVKYQSAPGSVATVGETGLLTAIGRGTAQITVSLTLGQTTRYAGRPANVFSKVSPSSIILTSGNSGWQPSAAQVIPGGAVEWRTGPVGWGGTPVTYIYLMNDRYGVIDSLDVRTGVATQRLGSAGLYYYCSGGCWDPPDFGAILVR